MLVYPCCCKTPNSETPNLPNVEFYQGGSSVQVVYKTSLSRFESLKNFFCWLFSFLPCVRRHRWMEVVVLDTTDAKTKKLFIPGFYKTQLAKCQQNDIADDLVKL